MAPEPQNTTTGETDSTDALTLIALPSVRLSCGASVITFGQLTEEAR